MRIGPVLVVDSWYVEGVRTPKGFYVIDVQPPAPPWAPRTRLTTRDYGLYSDCLGVEGLPIPLMLEYHRAGGQNVLEAVEMAEGKS
jgi:hypothetical protein